MVFYWDGENYPNPASAQETGAAIFGIAWGRSCRGGDLDRAITSWWRREANAFCSGDSSAARGVGPTAAASRDGGAAAGARGRSTVSTESRVRMGDFDGRKVRGMLGATGVRRNPAAPRGLKGSAPRWRVGNDWVPLQLSKVTVILCWCWGPT